MATTSTDPRRRGWLLAATGAVLLHTLPAVASPRDTGVYIEMWNNDGCGCCGQ